MTRSGKKEATLVEGARKPFDRGRPTGSAENRTDMDHTISAASIIRDPAANAHLTQEEQINFANSDKNLYEMDSSLNRSKGDKTTSEWLNNPNSKGQKPKDIFNITEEKEKEMLRKENEANEEYEKRIKEGEQKSIEAGKQSQKEAINYIKNPQNKNKPIGRLILEIGKIVIVGLTAVGSIGLGELIEKGLRTIPIIAIEIPLLGNLANIIGIFMGAVVSGIIGAIAINLIEKMIKRQYEIEIVGKKIDKSNEILKIQQKIIDLNENKVQKVKEEVNSSIVKRHKETSDFLRNTVNKIFSEKNKGIQRNKDNEENSNKEKLDEINSLLNELI